MSFIKEAIKEVVLIEGYLFHHNRRSKVLYYHDVGKVYTDMGTPLELIEKHINIIQKRGFEIVSHINRKENQVMVAFDDGWKGLYDNREFFVKKRINPTVFIAVDLIGKEGYMDINEIKELYQVGFQFESHTWTHTGLHTHSGDSLIVETLNARTKLEEMFGVSFNAICYPQGMFTKEVYNKCAEVGYDIQYSSICGSYYDYFENHLICRNLVQYTPPRQMKYILEGDSYIMRHHDIKHLFIGDWPFALKS